jgi:hypothetical protein
MQRPERRMCSFEFNGCPAAMAGFSCRQQAALSRTSFRLDRFMLRQFDAV